MFLLFAYCWKVVDKKLKRTNFILRFQFLGSKLDVEKLMLLNFTNHQPKMLKSLCMLTIYASHGISFS